VLVCPWAIVTEPGGVTELLLLPRVTVEPPIPAGPLRVIVPVEAFPPNTVVGLNEKDWIPTGVIVRFAVCDVPFKLPLIIAVVFAFTPKVVTLNVAEV